MDIISSSAEAAPNGAKIINNDVLPIPYAPSFSYLASQRERTKIRDILDGAEQMRAMGTRYIPKYANESDPDYNNRILVAPFENHFYDALDSICDKPFTKPVAIRGDAPDELIEFAEDVDGQGTSLHEFMRDSFKEAVAFGDGGFFVDFPSLGDGATLADQRNIKARPVWIFVCADDLLVHREAVRDGRRYLAELRFLERDEAQVGSIIATLRTVRVFRHDGVGAPEFEIWSEVGNGSWILGAAGTLRGMDVIPFKRFVTGRVDLFTRRIISPMNALADLQIQHFRQCSNLDNVLAHCAFPMLQGKGMNQPMNTDGTAMVMDVGPGCTLWTGSPPLGTTSLPEYAYLEPAGESVKLLMENLDRLVAAIDKLGKVPLIKSTGRVTATSDAISAAKGHATAEVWAAQEGKVGSTAFGFTAQWLNIALAKPVEVEINTDFGIEDGNITDGTELRNWIATDNLSQETGWEELRRRSILGSGWCGPDQERKRIADDQAKKLEQQKQTLALTATFAAAGEGGGGSQGGGPKPSFAPPTGVHNGPTPTADFERKEGGGSLSRN